MLEMLAGLAATASGGGLLGVLGGLIRQGVDYFAKKAEADAQLALLQARNAHELAMRDKDMAMMQAEAASRLRVAEEQGASAEEVARLAAVAASFASDKATYATGAEAADSPWFIAVDVVRGLIRPMITALFDVALLAIFGVLVALLWDDLSRLFSARDPSVTAPLMALILEILKAIIFLAVTTTSYWFVTRRSDSRTGA